MSKVLGKGSQLKVADAGDHNSFSSSKQRRGRRFDKYTEQEFLEAYLGKDYARRPDLQDDPNNLVFGFGDTLKEMFPDKNEFLTYPKMKEDQIKAKEFMGIYQENGKAMDPAFANYLKTVDMNKFMEEKFLAHSPHPTDPTRNFTDDLKARFAQLNKKIMKRDNNQFKPYEVDKIMKEVWEEYDTDTIHTKEEFEAFNSKMADTIEQRITDQEAIVMA